MPSPLPTVTATRYVTPLREGGSLPGLVEASDLGTYVVKFRAAGQGRKALVAEVVAGELARALGLPVPALVGVELDPAIGAAEPDGEIQELLKGSKGLNLGMDYLPGSLGYDPLAFPVEPELASQVLWFDALVRNVDRSWRNPNLLLWHRKLYLIDHGASLIFHHNWPGAQKGALVPFDATDHVLAAYAKDMPAADSALAPRVNEELLRSVVAIVPEEWLADEPGFASPGEVRDAYVDYLLTRVAGPRDWFPQAVDTSAQEAARAQKSGDLKARLKAKHPNWMQGRVK
ncbi:MAG: aminotransferase class I and II [Catenulispora sp. 13_1_20CM_3_70_7]|nr:MAG: aminotransferase class I and II [Catenulispora sp. 13_1_20CM_3_70_7]